ncbi:MAG: alpha-2-macroglobulin, partial [Deltaproteobacteria bacterium]|nr:alpha-2-macroglobulin [Deltaproteobacteria bacterium]
GWHLWGCRRPVWWWWPTSYTPPELVAQNEVPIGPEGELKIPIDTALAREMHADQDHQYSITVEVTDASRRTIVGTGTVLVARNPFKVYAWVDRGHYRTGDTVQAEFRAQTLDNKPVKGTGEATLFRIRYEQGKPVETAVESWSLPTDEQGASSLQIRAADAGQFRLSYKVTDVANHTMEGGYVFVVAGDSFDGAQFRFNDIELVPDRREYAPGEKVRLQININKEGGTVLLFVRPANGVYLPPRVLRLKGKSTVEEIEVVKKDMPNFFIEAVTIAGGKLFTDVREIIVPPEKRVLNVEVTTAEKFKPGEKAKVRIRLSDLAGKPFQGSAVLAVYDKSVEYISGGSNVPEIREFFWKWRRSHYQQTECSLNRWFGNVLKDDETGMAILGVFGGYVAHMDYSFADDSLDGDYGALEGKDMPRAAPAKAADGGGGRALMRNGGAKSTEVASKSEVAADKKNASTREARAQQATGGGDNAAGGAEAEAAVRQEFADTAFWAADLQTGPDGTAEVEFTMPENLTGWKFRTWGMGHGTKVGEGTATAVTVKNLLLRLQAPRFFVEKDEVVLSANVHNYLATSKKVRVVLELDGKVLEPLDALERFVDVASQGEARIDWRVRVVSEGEAVVRMKALSDEESDAMQMKFPAYVHGMLKTDSFSGVLRPEQQNASVEFDVPAERRPDQSRVEVRYSPTLAAAMVDALPYLADYPYGCTEQTLNRFLPAAITQNTLKKMGVKLEDIEKKITNLNAQEIGDDKGRARQWKRFRRSPVFEEKVLDDMVRTGVARLTGMQLSDGGWGWFSGWGEYSYPHTTAYVVHGLQIARANGVKVRDDVLQRGIAWLQRYQDEQIRMLKNAKKQIEPWKERADDLDAFIYMVLADADIGDDDMRDFLYRDRTSLAVYGKAMFGMALYRQKETEKLDMIMRNLDQFVVEDKENQSAWLNLDNGNYWWYWYGSEYEAHAYYLKLMSAVDPKNTKTSGVVKYLLNNRKHATYWNSTRDTALCVEAFADYLAGTGEDKPDMTLELFLDGKKQKEVKISSENLFTFDNKLVLSGRDVTTGKHTLELRRKGKGPVYFNAYVTNFTLEDYIKKAGLEVKVNRKYYKLVQVDKSTHVRGSRGQAVSQKVEKYERQEIPDLAMLKSGQLVEIELLIESKNDYEYLVFEDMKPAGFEPVEVQSGYNGNDMGAYVEFRDERVAFFVRALARGRHSVSYRMRAEIPGRFSALPTKAHAMYAPELKANSDEIKLQVED